MELVATSLRPRMSFQPLVDLVVDELQSLIAEPAMERPHVNRSIAAEGGLALIFAIARHLLDAERLDFAGSGVITARRFDDGDGRQIFLGPDDRRNSPTFGRTPGVAVGTRDGLMG